MPKVLYETRGEIAYITINRPRRGTRWTSTPQTAVAGVEGLSRRQESSPRDPDGKWR